MQSLEFTLARQTKLAALQRTAYYFKELYSRRVSPSCEIYIRDTRDDRKPFFFLQNLRSWANKQGCYISQLLPRYIYIRLCVSVVFLPNRKVYMRVYIVAVVASLEDVIHHTERDIYIRSNGRVAIIFSPRVCVREIDARKIAVHSRERERWGCCIDSISRMV